MTCSTYYCTNSFKSSVRRLQCQQGQTKFRPAVRSLARNKEDTETTQKLQIIILKPRVNPGYGLNACMSLQTIWLMQSGQEVKFYLSQNHVDDSRKLSPNTPIGSPQRPVKKDRPASLPPQSKKSRASHLEYQKKRIWDRWIQNAKPEENGMENIDTSSNETISFDFRISRWPQAPVYLSHRGPAKALEPFQPSHHLSQYLFDLISFISFMLSYGYLVKVRPTQVSNLSFLI